MQTTFNKALSRREFLGTTAGRMESASGRMQRGRRCHHTWRVRPPTQNGEAARAAAAEAAGLMRNHPKQLALLEAAAKRAGWGAPAPDVKGQKVFRGLCQTHGFGSYVAACAEVSVSREGALTVHRIVAATDPGYAVNPQQIEAQVEGSFVYGLRG